MNRLIIVLISLSLIQSANFLNHECSHNDNRDNFDPEVVDLELDDVKYRILEQTSPRKMKITYNMSFFDNVLDYDDPSDVELKQFCEKILKVVVLYFSDFLTIVPKPANGMKWSRSKETCAGLTIPQEDKETDLDSDLHLYVSVINDPSRSTFASSRMCRQIKTLGSTHGSIKFNLPHLKMLTFENHNTFIDIVQVVIHEIIHVIGFQRESYDEWVDSNKKHHPNPVSVQLIRGQNVTILQTPHVQSFAREYFDCVNLPGVPLENNSKSGAIDSHWEATIINRELMNPQIEPSAVFMSKFTTSLLRDTGYFASVNPDFEEETFFGKGAGCAFVLGDCDKNLREFCSSGKKNCDFDGFGIGYCHRTSYVDEKCHMIKNFIDQLCIVQNTSPESQESEVGYSGVSYGINSRCFMSNLSHPSIAAEIKGNCYSYSCNGDNQITIEIGHHKAICTYNQQILTVKGLGGQINCPDNLEQYCKTKKLCPNFCSSNGYCLKGICKCLEGYTGIDCSEQQAV